MDPKACLELAQDNYANGEYEEACYNLAEYFTWRIKGGFEPNLNGITEMGDSAAIILLAKLGKRADNLNAI